jgi:outer membrane protein TolC
MGGVAGLSKARKVRNYRKYDLLLIKQELARDIQTTFYDILQAGQIIAKWTESVKRLESQKDIARAWIAQELAPRLRLMEVESELFNALQQLASARARLAIAEARLRELLALQDNEPVELEGRLENSYAVNCGNAEACLDQALSQRPEIKLAQLNIDMAREDKKMIISRNLPRVSLDANWIDYTREFDEASLDGEDYSYYTVALNVNMRPFQGGQSLFAYRRQKLTVNRLENELFHSRAAIVAEVKSRYQQFVEAKAYVDSAAKGLDLAREIYNITEHSSRLGVTSLDDLLNAELRLTRAEVNKIDADFALQKARINLGYAAGEQLLVN